jgi:hypothetical protein
MQQPGTGDEGEQPADSHTDALLFGASLGRYGIFDGLRVIERDCGAAAQVAANQHDANGDEGQRQEYSCEADDAAEEASQAIAERSGAIQIDAESSDQAKDNEKDAPDVTAVTGQNPFSSWYDDVSSS